MSKKGGVVILPPISRTQEYSEPLLEVRNNHTPLPPIHSKQGVRAIPAVSIEAAESSKPLLGIRNDPLPPISRTDEPSEPSLEIGNDYTSLQEKVTSLIKNSEEELLKLEEKQNMTQEALDRTISIPVKKTLEYFKARTYNEISMVTKYLEEFNKINNDIKSLLENPSINGEKHNIEEIEEIEERLIELIIQRDSEYKEFRDTYVQQGEEQ
jgi:hypothetical protein